MKRDNNAKVGVLIADDHALIRTAFQTILATETDLVLVGEATNGDEAQQFCLNLRPDILLLDLNMPSPSAEETIKFLHQHWTEGKVIILTAQDDSIRTQSLIRTGIAGYLLKDDSIEEIVQAIKTVAQGGTWFSQQIMKSLFQLETSVKLSKREKQILWLVTQGWENSEIATELGLATQTVCNYISQIYASLNVTTRAKAIVWAREHGFCNINDL